MNIGADEFIEEQKEYRSLKSDIVPWVVLFGQPIGTVHRDPVNGDALGPEIGDTVIGVNVSSVSV